MVISVFGVDHPGIVAGVSQILAAAECSIVDINQTVVQGKFAMVIIGVLLEVVKARTNLKSGCGVKENNLACASMRSEKIYSTQCIGCD